MAESISSGGLHAALSYAWFTGRVARARVPATDLLIWGGSVPVSTLSVENWVAAEWRSAAVAHPGRARQRRALTKSQIRTPHVRVAAPSPQPIIIAAAVRSVAILLARVKFARITTFSRD